MGGLSLLLFVPLLLSGRRDLVIIGAGAQAWIATLINMPHFMASYRLVYRDRVSIMAHKWASIVVPCALIAAIIAALWEAQYSNVGVVAIIAVASAYLAWHYTGQVWGMMASYAYLDGVRYEPKEQWLIRSSLRILLVWHVTWFLYTQLRDPGRIAALYGFVSAGTLLGFALGAAGLIRLWRRTGQPPPARALVAWLAIFAWYAMMGRDPKAIFWVQIAHALQYLAFPARVELNRARVGRRTRSVVLHMTVYALLLLGVSVLMAQVIPARAMDSVGHIFGEVPGRAAPILLLMFLNIHHYFTDGVIWKIRNPAVRRDLFAHVNAESALPQAAAQR